MNAPISQSAQTILKRLASHMEGYRERDSQMAMIGLIESMLDAAAVGSEMPPVAVVEAPCGTGKSIGYSVAAIPKAIGFGKKIVISTGTVALQEQLSNKDLPELRDKGGVAFKYCLVKGRGRYACLAKLASISGYGAAQQDMLWKDGAKVEKAEGDTFARMRQLFEQKKWLGDRDSFPRKIDDQDWRRVTTDRSGCLSSACRFYKECPFFRARENMLKADVLVVNHDLLLSDAAMGGGRLLPEPAECVLVVDEAHRLAERALDHFASHVGVHADTRWLVEATEDVAKASTFCVDKKSIHEAVAEFASVTRDLSAGLGRLYGILDAEPAFGAIRASAMQGGVNVEPVVLRFVGGIVPEPIRVECEQMAEFAEAAAGCVEKIAEGLKSGVAGGLCTSAQAEGMITAIGELFTRIDRFRECLKNMATVDHPKAAPTARWVKAKITQGARLDFTLETSPISASRELANCLWDRYWASICTSATIRSTGEFDRFRRRVGLVKRDNVQCVALPSPFDYQSKATLTLAWTKASASDRNGFTKELGERLPQLIERSEGTLVLFCSRSQMEEVYEALPRDLQLMVLMQGTQDRERLLKQHAKMIGQGAGSVLFGLSSFAEGLDLRGALCAHVIITKLPFKVPDSPVEAATIEWLERMGRNPFMEVSVPDATLKLVQAAGRLLRTESDYGRVTILDRRLITQRYGQLMLSALPPFKMLQEDASGGVRSYARAA